MAKPAASREAGDPHQTSAEMDDTRFHVKNKNKSSSSGGNDKQAAKTPEQLLEDAKKKLGGMTDNHFFKENEARELPQFDISELGVGPRLGIGGFCVVSEIVSTNLDPDFDPSTDLRQKQQPNQDVEERGTTYKPEETEEDDGANDDAIMYGDLCIADQHDDHYDFTPKAARAFIAEHSLRKGHARYALKKLRIDLSDKQRENGILDLAIEAKFLAVISHPNIIKMRGTAASESLGRDYFIVLDRLYGTLDEKVEQWSDQHKSFSGCCGGIIGGDKNEMNQLMLDRLTAAYDIAIVLRYLHDQNIIYRDIKPENVGFDVRGDVKVFDFGLAKVLKRKDKLKGGLYKLTGRTGSRRYMAPEVVKCQPYNLMADTFSFGILLWQILAMQVPFENFTPRDHTEQVCDRGYRPSISSSWPCFARQILKDCWAAKINDRPDFIRISNVLRGEMKDIADTTRESIHNRTTHMMNKSTRSERNMMRGIPAESSVGDDALLDALGGSQQKDPSAH